MNEVRLHFFCDASQLLSFPKKELNGEANVHHSLTPNRVTLEKNSISRLELMSCLLAARLCISVAVVSKNVLLNRFRNRSLLN